MVEVCFVMPVKAGMKSFLEVTRPLVAGEY